MRGLTNILWEVANFLLFGALAKRRARAARQREFERLSRLRGFRRGFLRRMALREVNAHPALRHLPRRVRRAMARDAGNGAFRLERGLSETRSRGHWRRALRVASDLWCALPGARRGAATSFARDFAHERAAAASARAA